MQSFFFPLVLSRPVFEVSFLSFTPWFSPYLGGNNFNRIQWEKNLCPFLFQIHFYPFLSQQKLYGINTTMLCGEKRKTFCSLSSAGSWRVLGPCVVVHRILAFFLLSLYIGLRDYTVSLCEYGQLAFTNMYLSTFSCLKKEKKKTKKNGVIEGQQRVGLRCLGGLSGHFDNMASPLACLIVMFNGHPCSLR